MTFPTRHISVAIDRSVADVYAFAADPRNLPQWGAGLADASLTQSGDDWIANSPMGIVKIRFVERNPFGILDHDVTLPSGEVNYNPLRVVRNDNGCEITFTLFRRPRMSVEEFENDAAMIQRDLLQLKSILEAHPGDSQ